MESKNSEVNSKNEEESAINVKYLGEFAKIDGYIFQKIYKLPIKIDGKEITAYISVENKSRYTRDKHEVYTPTITVVGWYDLDDPICKEDFKRVNYDSYYSHSDEQKRFIHDEEEPEEQINLLDVQVPIPYDYVPNENDRPFMQRFKMINCKVANKIFELKKKYIIAKRKESFLENLNALEEKFPEIKLNTVLSSLNEEEKNKALRLFDKMIHCIMRGKYSIKDYYVFMQGLADAAKNKGIFLSEEDEKMIWKSTCPKMTSTFYAPSNRTLAGICPRQRETRTDKSIKSFYDSVLDVNHGNSSLIFFRLNELGENENASFRSDDTGNGKVKAIGNLKPFIICTGENDEVTIIHEVHKNRYQVKEDSQDYR